MPGRHYTNANGYRYGFNGKENDNEVVGTGSGTQDYGMRIYNPALGRFLSVDPLTKSYPWYTAYQFAGNTPIQAIDLDGLEELIITRNYNKCGNNYSTKIEVVNANVPLSITYNLLYDTDVKKIPVTTQVKDFTDEREKQVFNANWIKDTKTFRKGENSVPYVEIIYTLPKEAPAKYMVEIDLSGVTDGQASVTGLTIRDANGEIVFNKEYYSYDLVSAKNDFVKDVKKIVGQHVSKTEIKVNAGIIEGDKGLAKKNWKYYKRYSKSSSHSKNRYKTGGRLNEW